MHKGHQRVIRFVGLRNLNDLSKRVRKRRKLTERLDIRRPDRYQDVQLVYGNVFGNLHCPTVLMQAIVRNTRFANAICIPLTTELVLNLISNCL